MNVSLTSLYINIRIGAFSAYEDPLPHEPMVNSCIVILHAVEKYHMYCDKTGEDEELDSRKSFRDYSMYEDDVSE